MHHHAPIKRFGPSIFPLALIILAICPLSCPDMAFGEEEPPPGYSSLNMLKLAWATGQLKMVDLKLPTPESVVVKKGVEYGRAGQVSLKLDLFRPKDLDQETAGLIFIHGGGWKSGKRSDYHYYCVKFAEQGFVVTTITYRLQDVDPFPAAVEDAKCAVRWMRASAATIHVDPDRIGIIGGSAGGHLAMMVGYTSDHPSLEGTGGNQRASSRVQAVVNLYGPCDLTVPKAANDGLVTRFLGGKTIEDAPELFQLASPITHITEDDPPTLILHGTIDDIVPVTQSDKLDKRLTQAKIPHQYQRLEGWPHTMDMAVPVNAYCMKIMSKFFQEHLGEAASTR